MLITPYKLTCVSRLRSSWILLSCVSVVWLDDGYAHFLKTIELRYMYSEASWWRNVQYLLPLFKKYLICKTFFMCWVLSSRFFMADQFLSIFYCSSCASTTLVSSMEPLVAEISTSLGVKVRFCHLMTVINPFGVPTSKYKAIYWKIHPLMFVILKTASVVFMKIVSCLIPVKWNCVVTAAPVNLESLALTNAIKAHGKGLYWVC